MHQEQLIHEKDTRIPLRFWNVHVFLRADDLRVLQADEDKSYLYHLYKYVQKSFQSDVYKLNNGLLIGLRGVF